MKIKVDKAKLKILMGQKGIHTLTELAEKSGVSIDALWRACRKRQETLSRESLWIISDYLECSINDFVYPDWEDET